MSRKDILYRVRTQVKLVRTLSDRLREIAPDGLRSLRLDGAPRGSGYRGLEAKLEKKEAMERMLRRESELLRQYERDARREMDGMKPDHYAFCVLYYISGLSMEEAVGTMGKSVRQGSRYKQEIEMA